MTEIGHKLTEASAGLVLSNVEHEETGWWRFDFEGRFVVDVESPWRIIAAGRVLLGFEDHAQKFGLPAPLDGVLTAKELLANSPILSVSVDAETGDMRVDFDSSKRLEVFNCSSGYEGWNCRTDRGLHVVGMGGGNIAIFRKPA